MALELFRCCCAPIFQGKAKRCMMHESNYNKVEKSVHKLFSKTTKLGTEIISAFFALFHYRRFAKVVVLMNNS